MTSATDTPPVFWWNGLRELGLASFSSEENDGHDIPLYDGYNPMSDYAKELAAERQARERAEKYYNDLAEENVGGAERNRLHDELAQCVESRDRLKKQYNDLAEDNDQLKDELAQCRVGAVLDAGVLQLVGAERDAAYARLKELESKP